jgi:hypothetical protein
MFDVCVCRSNGGYPPVPFPWDLLFEQKAPPPLSLQRGGFLYSSRCVWWRCRVDGSEGETTVDYGINSQHSIGPKQRYETITRIVGQYSRSGGVRFREEAAHVARVQSGGLVCVCLTARSGRTNRRVALARRRQAPTIYRYIK